MNPQHDIQVIQTDLLEVGQFPLEAHVSEVNEALNRIYSSAPQAEEDLAIVQATTRALADYTKHVIALSQALMRVALTFQQQRDELVKVHADMREAFQRGDSNDPFVRQIMSKLYDKAMNEHNEAFWSSLPYDMATMLGDDWEHWNADTLFMAITVDPNEVDKDGEYFGFTYDQLTDFREKLLVMVQELMGEGD